MMSKIIKAAQLKINQIGKLYRLGLVVIGKLIIGQSARAQQSYQDRGSTHFLSREISLRIIDREGSCLSSPLSSLTLLCSLTSTFFSSLPSQLRELSLDCEVHTLAGAPILPSHSVAYSFIEWQELSLVSILSSQIAHKFKHYHALLLLGLRFASAQYTILFISLFFNLSVRELFFNLQLSNPLVKELLLTLQLSDSLVRELFHVQKIDEGKNNIAVGDKNQHLSQKPFYIAAHKNFFQPSNSQFSYSEYSQNYIFHPHTQSQLHIYVLPINKFSQVFISNVNSLTNMGHLYRAILALQLFNIISIYNVFINDYLG